MGRFEEYLHSRINPQLSGYIDYKWMKSLIIEIEKAILEDSTRVDNIQTKAQAFSSALDFNINRAVTFHEDKLAEAVTKLINIRRKWVYLSPQTLPKIHEEVKDVARGVCDCVQFIELNVETLKRIFQKTEKLLIGETEKSGKKNKRILSAEQKSILSKDEFLRSRLRPDNQTTSKLESLRVCKGFDRIAEELRRRCDSIRSLEAHWLQQGLIDAPYVQRVHGRKNTLPLLLELHQSVQQTVQKTKWYYGLVSQAKIDYEKEPVGEADSWGLFINNCNTFLYLANYYAVIPTANLYAASLGLPPIISGVLLSMAPLSAMFSSVLYSYWSNWSFKQPLFFCTLLLVLGNWMYSMAYDYKSAWFLFVGRLLVGFGGNRAVNRRYIADFVPLKDRTFHSALFVAVGSLGMSLGPGCQYFFDMMNFSVPYFNFTVNPLTAPGWVMCVCWIIFAFLVLVRFSEPVRRYASTNRRVSVGLLRPLLAANVSTDLVPSGSPSGLATSLSMIDEDKSSVNKSVTISETDSDGTVICLWIYFVLKLVQEAFQTIAPVFTENAYQWSAADIGYLLALIGLVVLPTNLLIGWISVVVDDRSLNIISLFLLSIGLGITINWSSFTVPAVLSHYIIGSLFVFLSAQCLEAVSMSLLTKVMPKIMSKGLWNSGFLSTEAGTLGRVIGAALITLVGSVAEEIMITSVVELQAWVVISCIALVAVTLVLCFSKWSCLVPLSERLERHVANDAENILKSEVWKRPPELRPLCVQLQEIQEMRSRINQAPSLASSIRSLGSSFLQSSNVVSLSSPMSTAEPGSSSVFPAREFQQPTI